MDKNKEYTDIEREYNTINKRFAGLVTAALLTIFIGAIAYHHMLHLTWVNAFYFCTVTLTTVGYGDITPNTDVSKIFTIFYILVGVGIIANFATLVVRRAGIKRDLRKERRKINKQ
ncbi:MAG TPA: potassium channel family protein [Patescibacteria group bacterium]|nr:potassium channel family protein [Patescibacteria group bacterium]